MPASAAAGELSVTVTSSPARAATSAIPDPINPQPTTPTFRSPVPRRNVRDVWRSQDLARFLVEGDCDLGGLTAAHSSRPTLMPNDSADGAVISAVSWIGPSQANTNPVGARRSTSITAALHVLRWLPSGRLACNETACGRITAIAGPSMSSAATNSVGAAIDREDTAHHRPGQQVDAHQFGDIRGARMGGDIGERPILHDVAVLDDHHPVGKGVRVDRVVRDEDRPSPGTRRDVAATRDGPRPALQDPTPPTDRRAAAAWVRTQVPAPGPLAATGESDSCSGRDRSHFSHSTLRNQCRASWWADCLVDTTRSETERHVLEHRHAGEQLMLIRHDPARPLRRRHENVR